MIDGGASSIHLKEKVMNDEILIQLGDVSEETKGTLAPPAESATQDESEG